MHCIAMNRKFHKMVDFCNYLKRIFIFYLYFRVYTCFLLNRKNYLYIGAVHIDNVGDTLLFKIIKNNLASVNLVPVVPNPFSENTLLYFIFEVMLKIFFMGGRGYCGIVVGGGTLLNNNFFFKQVSKYYNDKLPLFVVGAAVCSTEYGNSSLRQESKYLKNAKMILVRDPASQSRLESISIMSRVIGDPVLGLGSQNITEMENKGIRIAVNLVSPKQNILMNQCVVVEQVKRMIQYCLTQGYLVDFLAFNAEDYNFINKIIAEGRINSVPVVKCYNFSTRILAEINRYKLVVSQRLHGCIISASFLVPCVSIAYDRKCSDFMDSIGMSDYVVLSNNQNVDVLVNYIRDIEQNYSSIKRKLYKNVGYFISRQAEAFLELKQIIYVS